MASGDLMLLQRSATRWEEMPMVGLPSGWVGWVM